MKSIFTTAVVALTLLASQAVAQAPSLIKGGDVQMRAYKLLGCYKYPGSFVDFGPYDFQALGYCQPLCVRQAQKYLAFVNGTNCLCGASPPDDSNKVDSSQCNVPCTGYDQDMCGGTDFFAVYDDGYRNGDNTGTVHITTPAQTAFTISPTGAADSTSGAQTVYLTQSGVAQASVVVTDTAQAGGPNKAAIAAGVVVGIIAFAALVGGLIFFIRHKKQKALDAERRRHENMTNFVNGEKPPSTYSLADSRLEPSVMFQRRQSDGSIMDNQDYSRRILKVTNPDER